MEYFSKIQEWLRRNWFFLVGLVAIIFPAIDYGMEIGLLDEFPRFFSSVIGLLNVVAAFFGLAPIPQPSQSAAPTSIKDSKKS